MIRYRAKAVYLEIMGAGNALGNKTPHELACAYVTVYMTCGHSKCSTAQHGLALTLMEEVDIFSLNRELAKSPLQYY